MSSRHSPFSISRSPAALGWPGVRRRSRRWRTSLRCPCRAEPLALRRATPFAGTGTAESLRRRAGTVGAGSSTKSPARCARCPANAAFSAPRRPGEPMTIAMDFVRSNLAALGLEASDLEGYAVSNVVYSKVTGATHIYLQQRYQGIPVYNAQLQINVNRDGRIISVNNSFMAGIAARGGFAEAGHAIARGGGRGVAVLRHEDAGARQRRHQPRARTPASRSSPSTAR